MDKFLKVSRLIKRRTLAKEICERGQVSINGRIAKAGNTIKPGDIIEIDFGRRQLKVEFVGVEGVLSPGVTTAMYRVIEEDKD